MNKLAQTLTVYVVDDDPAICNTVSCLLKAAELKVQAYQNPFIFLKDFNMSMKGCLLLDVRMPTMSGLELQEKLIAKSNTMPIIFMSGYGDIPIAVRAMKLGALDFITKPLNDEYLIEEVQKVLTPNHQPSVLVSPLLLAARYALLTEQECDVLQRIVAGKMNKVIAHEMAISIQTVGLHRRNIMQKMQAKNVAELVRYYLQLQLA